MSRVDTIWDDLSLYQSFNMVAHGSSRGPATPLQSCRLGRNLDYNLTISFNFTTCTTKPSVNFHVQRFAKFLHHKLESGSFVHVIFKILANETNSISNDMVAAYSYT